MRIETNLSCLGLKHMPYEKPGKKPGRRSLLLASVTLSAVTAFAVPVLNPGMLQAEVKPSESLVGPDGSYAELVRRDRPAIVTIETRMGGTQMSDSQQMGPQGGPEAGPNGGDPYQEFFRRFFGENGPQGMGPQMGPQGQMPERAALGSGFIISSDGIIVTNNHVVDGANTIKVTLDDGRSFDGKVLGTDPRTDIAVVKVDATGLPTVQWGNSDNVEVGDKVVAIGNPFGVGPTVTAGIVSARGRDLHNGPYDDFLQVDAAINHGNSGGALISTDGKVIGITSAIYSPNNGSVGVGFAIPSSMAQQIVADLEKDGSVDRGYLGVKIQSLESDMAAALGLDQAQGAMVSEVTDGTPAADAGMKQGDVVLAVNDTPVNDARALSRAIAALQPGTDTKLTVWRDGAKKDLTVKLGTLPAEDQMASNTPSQAQPEQGKLGLTLKSIDPQERQQLGLSDNQSGVVVTAVDPQSDAAQKGMRPGDVILSAAQKPVSQPSDVNDAVSNAQSQGRGAVLLLVERQGQEIFIALPVKET